MRSELEKFARNFAHADKCAPGSYSFNSQRIKMSAVTPQVATHEVTNDTVNIRVLRRRAALAFRIDQPAPAMVPCDLIGKFNEEDDYDKEQDGKSEE